MNSLSSLRRLGSRSGLILPPHPPRPLIAMLHNAAAKAASYSHLSSVRSRTVPRRSLVALHEKWLGKVLGGKPASSFKYSSPVVNISVSFPDQTTEGKQRRALGKTLELIYGSNGFSLEPLVQLHLGFPVTELVFLPEWAATFLSFRIDVARLLDGAQQAPTEISCHEVTGTAKYRNPSNRRWGFHAPEQRGADK